MGGKKGLLLTLKEITHWNILSIDVQYEICNYKINNYSEVREDLKKSENKILIHPAMRCSEEKVVDRIWEGKGVIKDEKIIVLGKNLLGKIWMELRELL
jgi:predicted NAD-dependent protein-ADP-ribosyltransferase YbiA (DUF1768 family)